MIIVLLLMAFALNVAARAADVTGEIPIRGDYVVTDQEFRFSDTGAWVSKGFVVKAGTNANIVRFERCKFIGDGSLNCNRGPVLTSESGADIERFEIIDCEFVGLTYGASINCSRGGRIGLGMVTGCRFTDIVGADADRGKGLAFSLNGHGRALSLGNRFERCGRHSLYISNGGLAESVGDTFVANNATGTTSFPLAAISIARGGNVAVRNGLFVGCRDGISLTDDDVNRPKRNVTIEGCRFLDSVRYDIFLNGDNPGVSGLFEDVVVRRTHHESLSSSWVGVAAFSFGKTTLGDVMIHDRRGNTGSPALWFTGRGPSHGLSVSATIVTRRPRERAAWTLQDTRPMDVRNLKVVSP